MSTNLEPIDLAAPFQIVQIPTRAHDGSDEATVWAAHGQPEAFRPAGMPVPTWCVVVNPMVHDDPTVAFSETDLNEAFAPFNNDATLTLIEEADSEQVAGALWQAALRGANDHAQCDNGGAYVLWRLSGNRVVVGGFDNAGSDIAGFESARIAEQQGKVVIRFGDAHFHAERFTDPASRESREDCDAVRAILDALAGESLRAAGRAKP